MKKKYLVISIISIIIISVVLTIYIQFNKKELGNELFGVWLPLSTGLIREYNKDGSFIWGDMEDRKCDLWGCVGYEEGKYEITKEKDKKTIRHCFGKSPCEEYKVDYEIIKEKENSYLVTTERSIDAQQTRYIKVK